MEKILTIVIPTYNMENFLPKALTSLVVEEELMNILEVIVVNDGSKDSSLDIAYAFLLLPVSHDLHTSHNYHFPYL